MNRGFTTINLEVVNSGGDCRGDSSAFSYENGLLIQDVIHSNVDIVGEGTRRFTSYSAPSLEVRGPDRWSVSVSLPPVSNFTNETVFSNGVPRTLLVASDGTVDHAHGSRSPTTTPPTL
jgi:hypothetical protein